MINRMMELEFPEEISVSFVILKLAGEPGRSQRGVESVRNADKYRRKKV